MKNNTNNNHSFHLGTKSNFIILSIFPLCLLIIAFFIDSPQNIINGLHKIIVSPDILLTDYLAVGGIGAAFVNTALLTLVGIYMLYILKLKINGTLIAAIFSISGFAFIGKNILNVWPIYLGGFIYSKYENIHMKSIILALMFATALAPVVSEIAFGLDLDLKISIPLGILVGIMIGFVITPLASHMVRFHDGYNLYNMGFTAGILATLITSILRSFGLIIETQSVLSYEYSNFLRNILIIMFISMIVLGFIINKKSFKGYINIFKYKGRLVTDFTKLVGYGITYMNMGIMGLICVLYVIVSKGYFNGPVVAGILTVVGFSAFGKHPKNAIPILIGVYVTTILNIWDISSTTVIMAGLFGTTLAPITGTYGFTAGIIAGFLHVAVVMNVVKIHGGLNLYNNGFSGGIVASIMVPIAETLKNRGERNETGN